MIPAPSPLPAVDLAASWPLPEKQLLLEAALAGAERAVPAFRNWQAKVDLAADLGWDTVRLFPLAYHNLQGFGVSDPVMGRLKGVYRRTWYESQRLMHHSGTAVGVLRAHGIDPLLLDGVALALTCYASPALRPVTRLDLMVRRSEVKPAIGALRRAGWQSSGEGSDDDLRFADHLRLWGPEETELRLHWQVLAGGPGVDRSQSTWLAGAPFDWQGTRLSPLDPTNQLARTILEGLCPAPRASLQWVPDAVMALRVHGDDVDWPRLLVIAAAHRMTARLAIACAYLAEHFGVAIPAGVRTRLQRYRAPLMERIADAAQRSAGFEAPDWGPRPRGTVRTEFRRYLAWRRGLGNPVRTTLEFSHFLRYWWGLSGRRELLPLVFRGGGGAARPPLLSQR